MKMIIGNVKYMDILLTQMLDKIPYNIVVQTKDFVSTYVGKGEYSVALFMIFMMILITYLCHFLEMTVLLIFRGINYNNGE